MVSLSSSVSARSRMLGRAVAGAMPAAVRRAVTGRMVTARKVVLWDLGVASPSPISSSTQPTSIVKAAARDTERRGSSAYVSTSGMGTAVDSGVASVGASIVRSDREQRAPMMPDPTPLFL